MAQRKSGTFGSRRKRDNKKAAGKMIIRGTNKPKPDGKGPGILIPGVYKPPVEGVPNRVLPFLTPEQLLAAAEDAADYAGQRNQLGFDLESFKADVEEGKADVRRSAGLRRSDADDDAIGRGLFQSSIRDSALWDIDKWETTSVQRLDDNLKMMNDQTVAKLSALNTEFTQKKNAYFGLMAENAAKAATSGEKWLVKPEPGRWEFPSGQKGTPFEPQQLPRLPKGQMLEAERIKRKGKVDIAKSKIVPLKPKRPRRPTRPRTAVAGY